MPEDNKLQVILTEQNVAKENAELLLRAFGAPFEEAGKILAEYQTIIVTKEDDFAQMAEARTKRLALKEIRVSVEHKRKELKEDSLRTGKAIDSVAKFVKEIIEPAEAYLEEQEKFGEIKAAERAAKVKAERIEKLMQYTDDISAYNIDTMDDTAFSTLLSGLKSIHEAKLAEAKRIEDERIAKEKADAEEQERVRTENARLKKEAEQREIKAAEEKKAADAEREAERKAAQAKIDEEREKREAAEAAQRKEREEREAKERADREAAEAAKREAEEKERAELLAPDKQKLVSFAMALDTISQTKLPAVKSKQAQDVLNQVEAELQSLSVKIKRAAEAL